MTWTLVTGAAKGLGRAVALTLADKGYDIVIHYNQSEKQALEVAQECCYKGVAAEVIQGDFSTQAGVLDFIHRYNRRFSNTKHLINNVGNYFESSLVDTPDDLWLEMFQTNVHAPYQLVKALLPGLKSNKGSIVNMGFSGVERLQTSKAAVYNMTKVSLWMLTRSLAGELAPEGVRVNMVSPGHLENTVCKPSGLPMARMGTLEETARVVAFFVDDANNYITGQNIEVAGGVRL